MVWVVSRASRENAKRDFSSEEGEVGQPSLKQRRVQKGHGVIGQETRWWSKIGRRSCCSLLLSGEGRCPDLGRQRVKNSSFTRLGGTSRGGPAFRARQHPEHTHSC